MLADFALGGFVGEEEGVVVLPLLDLVVYPVFEAAVVDVFHAAGAETQADQRVVGSVGAVEADSALDLACTYVTLMRNTLIFRLLDVYTFGPEILLSHFLLLLHNLLQPQLYFPNFDGGTQLEDVFLAWLNNPPQLLPVGGRACKFDPPLVDFDVEQ